jgi:hypothetical protein
MDLNIREYSILLVLVIFTVSLGIYPSIVTDGLNYVTQGLLYTYNTITDSIESITYNDDSEVNPNSDISRLLNTPELSPTPEPMQVPRNTPVNVIPRNFTFEYVDFRNESNEITSLTSNISQPDTSTIYAPISGNIQFK